MKGEGIVPEEEVWCSDYNITVVCFEQARVYAVGCDLWDFVPVALQIQYSKFSGHLKKELLLL